MQPNPFLPQQPAAQSAPAPAAPVNPYAQPQQYAAPAPVQQYAPQPAAPQYAAPAGNVPVAQPGQFVRPGAPLPPGQGNIPAVADLALGRLLIILPERCDRNVPSKFPNDDGTPKLQDKMTATVVVLDGGPLRWGMSPQNPQGTSANTPHVIKGMWIQQRGLVSQLEEALALRLTGGPGLALGRLWKAGTAKNDPYVLAEPNEQDVQAYNHYVSQVNPFSL